ncbi:uridine kinase family protein [Streptomyces anthocyanicus]|uniref:uridine kinase family protein n=1 Tax=Streptomyces anthocyanicus TaxID=68174 RepID=UPI00380D384C
MFPDPPPRNLLALAGGAGSGKTTLAESVAAAHPRTALLQLDHYVHTQPERAPLVPSVLGTGEVIDFSDPRAIDWGRVQQAISEAPAGKLLVVEGTFALEKQIRQLARWTVYLDTPDDLRLARKTLRRIGEGVDPRIGLLGYLARGREGHHRHVAPMRQAAGLVLDGTLPTKHLTDQLIAHVANEAKGT